MMVCAVLDFKVFELIYTCTSQSVDDRSFIMGSRPPCSKISTLQENSATRKKKKKIKF